MLKPMLINPESFKTINKFIHKYPEKKNLPAVYMYILELIGQN